MPEIVQIALLMIAGLAGLVWSAHFFVGGSAALAKHLGMRPGLIGLTIVAFGTSAPEIVVSADSALKGASDLGVGNAIGSNIANIGLVLGASCLIAKIPIGRPLFRLEIPLLIVATAAAFVVLFNGYLSRTEGAVLLFCAILLPFIVTFDAQRKGHTVAAEEAEALEDEIPELTMPASWLWLAGGLIALLFSSHLLVDSATDLAILFGVKPMIVGLTVVALGTSLPELAASIASIIKGHTEMAIGNILGSNILNIFAVMSLPGLILPVELGQEVFSRDTITMTVLTVALLLIGVAKTLKNSRSSKNNVELKEPTLGWVSGALFLSVYVAYYGLIFSTINS